MSIRYCKESSVVLGLLHTEVNCCKKVVFFSCTGLERSNAQHGENPLMLYDTRQIHILYDSFCWHVYSSEVKRITSSEM